MGLNIPRPVGGERVWIVNPSNVPVPVFLQVGDDGTTPILNDDGALAVLDFAHFQIHEGNLFKTHYRSIVNSGVNIDLVLVAPNLPYQWHFDGIIGSSAGAEVSFRREIVEAGDGAELAVYNANQQSAKTNSLRVFLNPTITNIGTEIDGGYLGAGNVLGGSIRGEEEWDLNYNTKYLLRTTSAGNNNRISLRINWYELVE